SLIGEPSERRRVDRSLQTAARAEPVRPDGDIASAVSRAEPHLSVGPVAERLVAGLAAATERSPRELLFGSVGLYDADRPPDEQRPVGRRRDLDRRGGRNDLAARAAPSEGAGRRPADERRPVGRRRDLDRRGGRNDLAARTAPSERARRTTVDGPGDLVRARASRGKPRAAIRPPDAS